jgi:hypothetical protein
LLYHVILNNRFVISRVGTALPVLADHRLTATANWPQISADQPYFVYLHRAFAVQLPRFFADCCANPTTASEK